MQINKELQDYIENNIFPEYEKNEKGHGIDHIKYVIQRSFQLVEENNLDVNPNMVYTIASYHDIGHHIDSKTHEIISADIMSKDKNLSRFFTKDELVTIKEKNPHPKTQIITLKKVMELFPFMEDIEYKVNIN